MRRQGPIRPQPQLAEPVQVAEELLHHPAEYPQPAAVLGIPPRQLGLDPPAAQPLPMRLAVIGPVPVQRLRPAPGPTRLAADVLV